MSLSVSSTSIKLLLTQFYQTARCQIFYSAYLLHSPLTCLTTTTPLSSTLIRVMVALNTTSGIVRPRNCKIQYVLKIWFCSPFSCYFQTCHYSLAMLWILKIPSLTIANVFKFKKSNEDHCHGHDTNIRWWVMRYLRIFLE